MLVWLLFIGLILFLLMLDLGVFHRKAHVVTTKEAMKWSAMWISLGISFAAFIYFGYEYRWLGLGVSPDPIDGAMNNGYEAAIKYLTGYIVEESLSVDNIFVISMLFGFFAVPAIYRHRVLFWGIIGAIVLRGVMITAGVKLIAEFHWIIYIFGAFLVITGIKMLFARTEKSDPNKNILVRAAKRILPVTSQFHGEHFFVRAGQPESYESEKPGEKTERDEQVEKAKKGTLMMTPLAIVLIVVETTDVIFAVDSIPAIFSITADPFLVFTSNIWAILGLRSLYFVLAGLIRRFRYLKLSLSIILVFVGVKMLLAEQLKHILGEYFNLYILAIVLSILACGVLASLIVGRHNNNNIKNKE